MARGEVTVRLRRPEEYFPAAQRKALLEQLAALAIGRIKRRTGQGLDVNGSKFTAYSAGYATQRKAAGRNADPPTLLLTGAMLGSMQVLTNDGERAVIGFAGSSAKVSFAKRKRVLRGKAYARREKVGGVWVTRKKGDVIATHTFRETNQQIPNAMKALWNDRGGGKVPRRHFFGLSKDDKRELVRTALRRLVAMARAASPRK